MREVFDGRAGFLYEMLHYHLGWADERGQAQEGGLPLSFQPALALASCKAISGDASPALPAAAGVELVRNFTVVHGEVQSNRLESQERPSVWWVWGPAQAINAGDGLHVLGRTTIMRLAQKGVPPDGVLRAVESLDRACLALCEGQYMDLDFRDRTLVSTAAYFQMAEMKSGALAACSAELGSIAAGSSGEVSDGFKEFGKALGTAWQVASDTADLWGRESGVAPSIALDKKKGFPLVHALETAPPAVKRELSAIYMKRVLEPEDTAKLLELLEQSKSRQFAEAKAREIAGQALAFLDDAGLSSEGREELSAMAEWALEGGT